MCIDRYPSDPQTHRFIVLWFSIDNFPLSMVINVVAEGKLYLSLPVSVCHLS